MAEMTARLTLGAVAALLIVLAAAAPIRADTSDETGCDQTEYAAYRDCVHAAAAARPKRQLPGGFVAQQTIIGSTDDATANITVSCKRLNYDCRIACGNDTVCESHCPVCPLNWQQLADDTRTVLVETADGRREGFQARVEAGRNFTTIIRLTNILNNTNHIHIPTNVTTNNVNNVNLHTNRTSDAATTGGDYDLGYTANGSCCFVVPSSNCRTSTTGGQRCRHQRRQRMCDSTVCKARVMHAQWRRRCHRTGGGCRRTMVYVPEPAAQKCVRIPSWPFIACGTLIAAGEETYAEQQFAYQRRPPPPPPSPYYYGSSWMDYGAASWGPPPQPQYPPQSNYYRPSSHRGDRDVYYEDEVEDDETETAVDNDKESGEWVVEDTKCKVVSENGTRIENCTSNSLDENEYATEPKVNFARDAGEDEAQDNRHKRQTAVYDAGYDAAAVSGRRRRRHNNHRRPHLDHNYVDDREDERYVQQLPRNRIADDFEYDEELDHPYKRPNRRRHGRGGGRRGRNGKKHQRKIVYDEEE